MTDIHYIYWIHAPDHTDMLSEGYIGVSKDVKKRWQAHKRSIHKNSDNPIFKNAIAKYGWENLIKKILLCSIKEYCYEIEKKLRPNKEIGWNYNVGGIWPPISRPRGENYSSPLKGKKRFTPWMFGAKHMIGKKASEETKLKMSAKRKGKKQSEEHIAKRVASRNVTIQHISMYTR